MSIVSSEWLNKNIDKVKIIDCSWHMPSENRNPLEEYKNDHIINAKHNNNALYHNRLQSLYDILIWTGIIISIIV